MAKLKFIPKNQVSMFDIVGRSLISQATDEVAELYPNEDLEEIKAAIGFSGLPMFEGKAKAAFFDRVGHYFKVIRWKNKYPLSYIYRINVMRGTKPFGYKSKIKNKLKLKLNFKQQESIWML